MIVCWSILCQQQAVSGSGMQIRASGPGAWGLLPTAEDQPPQDGREHEEALDHDVSHSKSHSQNLNNVWELLHLPNHILCSSFSRVIERKDSRYYPYIHVL